MARYWATSGAAEVDETALDGLKASGAPQEVLDLKRAELRRSQTQNTLECWPEHWHVWHLFSAMGTQWDAEIYPSGKRHFTRLRYEVLDAVEPRILPLIAPPDRQPSEVLFEQLRILERQALPLLNAD